MPELPDVEVFRRYFDATSLNRRVEQVDVSDQRILGDTSGRELRRALNGHVFTKSRRHGKFMFVGTDGSAWLVLHFGMTGYLHFAERGSEVPGYTRVQFEFADGARLALVDQRMLGLVGLTEDPDEYVSARRLGPDVLALDQSSFPEILGRRKGSVKSALTNQNIIAGIGNIYADEILFNSRIHPKTQVGDLSPDDLATMFRKTGCVLQKAIDASVDVQQTPRTWLLPHRSEGSDCPRCSAKINVIKMASRTTYFCPSCQPEG